MPQHHETQGGDRFYNGTMPKIANALPEVVDALNRIAAALEQLPKATEEVKTRAEDALEAQIDKTYPPGSIGEGMVFIDQSGLSNGIPVDLKGRLVEAKEELEEDEETEEDGIRFLDGETDEDEDEDEVGECPSNASAHSLMSCIMLDTMNFSPAVLLDYGLEEPHQKEKFSAISFVVKMCNVSTAELHSVRWQLPSCSYKALQKLCKSPTHSPWYGLDLWEEDGSRKPK